MCAGEKPQTFDGEVGTYSDWKCCTCKPEPVHVLDPMERAALFFDIACGKAHIVYAREQNGFVYMTVRKHTPFMTDIIMQRTR